MSQEARCNSVYNLMRRLPTQHTTKSLSAVMSVAPELADDILPNIDEPLRVVKDTSTGRDFVICDYNRDGDSYRSPHSNKYFDPDTGRQTNNDFFPSDELRSLEIAANNVFDRYRDQYFQGGLSSVYYFDCDEGFGAAWLIHKEVPGVDTLKKGWWDSSHIFDVQPTGVPNQYKYTLTSTVLISMNLEEAATGEVDLSGSLSMQITKTRLTDKFTGHIQNMGPMLEEQESLLRNRIEVIYIQKTREILGVRSSTGQRDAASASIAQSLKERSAPGSGR